jgi:probable rRNA maturation factor
VDPDSKRPPRLRQGSGARGRRASERLRVFVSDGRGRPVRDGGLSRWLAAAAPARSRGEVAVALVTDAHITKLNQQYRHQNTATDVLSFPFEHPGSRIPAGSRIPDPALRQAQGVPSVSRDGSRQRSLQLGDIVIATGVARRQARAAGHSYATEVRVLALHGLLHLLGYDHDDREDAGRMSRVEARLRRQAGLPTGLIERGSTPAGGTARRSGRHQKVRR